MDGPASAVFTVLAHKSTKCLLRASYRGAQSHLPHLSSMGLLRPSRYLGTAWAFRRLGYRRLLTRLYVRAGIRTGRRCVAAVTYVENSVHSASLKREFISDARSILMAKLRATDTTRRVIIRVYIDICYFIALSRRRGRTSTVY